MAPIKRRGSTKNRPTEDAPKWAASQAGVKGQYGGTFGVGRGYEEQSNGEHGCAQDGGHSTPPPRPASQFSV